MLVRPGSPPQLSWTEVPDPVPGPGEVLVRVAACGFCYHDLLVMRGLLQRGVKPALILGHEVSGTVTQVGPEVTTVRPGDRVVTLLTDACGSCDRCYRGMEHRCLTGNGIGHGRDGGFAQYIVVSQFSLVTVPDGLDLTTAAVFACPMGVALQGLKVAAQVRPGEAVAVIGAGGGLGVHAVQLAAALGCRVLALTSSPEKVTRLIELGAAEVVEAGPLDFSEVVLALTEDQGANVVIDTVGSALFSSTWPGLAQFGRWVILGEVAGGSVELNPAEIIFRDAKILGSSGVSREIVTQVTEIVSQNLAQPVVTHTLPMEQAHAAIDLIAGRNVLGRVVLVPP